ncbi:MAG: ABC transporter ATP-binding protein [Spirochaetes bacterium]|nr:ABC transporter ATP-binding protein [Spirochaetota bacterium]
MIQVENLKKTFGPVKALDGISFTIEKGEVVGFLGPNGAGKTTAMRIIAGYMSATDGTALIEDVNIDDEPIAIKSKIGYLPEQPPLYHEMRVKNYLSFVAEIKGVKKEDIDSNVNDAMKDVNIMDKSTKIIGNLSKGYKQRVGLAGALVHKPQILILDEPTVGLDPNQIREIRKLINNLKAEDRTIIISTHILAEVEQTCEKVIIINNGKIVTIDTKEELTKGSANQSRIEVEVARNPHDAVEKLNALEDVTVIEQADNKLLVSVDSGKDLREEIAKAVLDSGSGLLSMILQKIALEDIFVELTKNEETSEEETTKEADDE